MLLLAAKKYLTQELQEQKARWKKEKFQKQAIQAQQYKYNNW
jgi:hypothetical protein